MLFIWSNDLNRGNPHFRHFFLARTLAFRSASRHPISVSIVAITRPRPMTGLVLAALVFNVVTAAFLWTPSPVVFPFTVSEFSTWTRTPPIFLHLFFDLYLYLSAHNFVAVVIKNSSCALLIVHLYKSKSLPKFYFLNLTAPFKQRLNV